MNPNHRQPHPSNPAPRKGVDEPRGTETADTHTNQDSHRPGQPSKGRTKGPASETASGGFDGLPDTTATPSKKSVDSPDAPEEFVG